MGHGGTDEQEGEGQETDDELDGVLGRLHDVYLKVQAAPVQLHWLPVLKTRIRHSDR
jgi:hypothetical protein